MSDGPHRSLKMNRSWKELAKRADNRAYASEEVSDALPKALSDDWRAEVPDNLCRKVGDILRDVGRSLFGDQRVERLEALRWSTAGYNLGNAFLDYAIQVAAEGLSGSGAVKEAAQRALSDRAARGARQVEEHYYRESTQGRATSVRQRIETGISQCDMTGIAGHLVGTRRGDDPRRSVMQTGLDDGVKL